MKKTFFFAVLLLILAACHRKTVAAANDAPKIIEAPKADPAEAELIAHGQTVYTNRCGRCHNLKTTTDFTPKQWEGILQSMIPKAKLDDTQAKQVTAYVMANAKK